MVSHRRGINHDAFKINAFHLLLELLKEFRPDAPLGPPVEFGVNASPFAVFDGQGPPTQPIGKHMKNGDKECPVVLGGAASISQNGRQNFHHEIEHFFAEEKRCGLLVVGFSFRLSCPTPLSREFFSLGKYGRSVDAKKHYEIMAQLLLLLLCCASSKKSNPDLQWSLESLSFDFSTPAQTNPTGDGINTSRKLFLFFLIGRSQFIPLNCQ